MAVTKTFVSMPTVKKIHMVSTILSLYVIFNHKLLFHIESIKLKFTDNRDILKLALSVAGKTQSPDQLICSDSLSMNKERLESSNGKANIIIIYKIMF